MEMSKTKKCVGCGLCCVKAKCAAAIRLYSGAIICPALKWNGKRHICDLMELPGQLGEIYRSELYAGEGCCMGLFNDWRSELKDRTKDPKDLCINDQLKNPIPPLMQKFLAALGREPFLNGSSMTMAISSFITRLINDGMSESEAYIIEQRVIGAIVGQQPSFMKGFMPDVESVPRDGKGSK